MNNKKQKEGDGDVSLLGVFTLTMVILIIGGGISTAIQGFFEQISPLLVILLIACLFYSILSDRK